MCPSAKLLSQTKNGVFTHCSSSQLFQLVYNNLCFEFYEWELNKFRQHLKQLNVSYWENQLKSTIHKRKIPISVDNKYFVILLNREEVLELKRLLGIEETETKYLDYKEINYQYLQN